MWLSYQPDFWGQKVVQHRWIIKSKYTIILAVPPPLPASLLPWWGPCSVPVAQLFPSPLPFSYKETLRGKVGGTGMWWSRGKRWQTKMPPTSLYTEQKGVVKTLHNCGLRLPAPPPRDPPPYLWILKKSHSVPSPVWCLSSFVRLNLNFAIFSGSYQQKHGLLKSCSSRKEGEWLRGRGAAAGRDREERRKGGRGHCYWSRNN